ncbi:MAG: hypothetical protein ACI4P0_02840 [Mailhella sp.]
MASSAVYAKTLTGRAYRGRFGVDRSIVIEQAIRKGTIITTPEYVVGSQGLHVYLGGLLCQEGTDESACVYSELGLKGTSSTTILWLQDSPADFEVLIESV